MKNLIPALVFIGILIVVDLYTYKSLRLLTSPISKTGLRTFFHMLYWAASLATYSLVIYAFLNFNRQSMAKEKYFIFFMGFSVVLLFIMPKIIVVFFHLFDDLIHGLRYLAQIITSSPNPADGGRAGITRWQFINRTGWVMAALPFVGILYGILRGRFDFRIERHEILSNQWPDGENSLRIVQISDMHIGSFFDNHAAVLEGIEKVNALEPDIICFTGDMVNNFANELDGWEPIISQLKAKYGKFSILGNHDYGDYVQWSSAAVRTKNLDDLKRRHEEMGFRLLLNEKVDFALPSGKKIEIIGIENWGLGGFSQYGDLAKATAKSDPTNFQLLLSHDPSHWDAEVLDKTSINLSLAGHTHGMQFGVEIPGIIKWSPVKYRYPRWAGLYQKGNQHLHVNRGFGYIGFAGRVGMRPEISLLELKKG